jgi:hypothetical protein
MTSPSIWPISTKKAILIFAHRPDPSIHNPLACEINSVNSSNNDHCITNQSTEPIDIADEEAMTQSVLGNPPEKDGAAININVECRLCLKKFPIATVEQHADQCASLFQIIPDGDDHDDNEDSTFNCTCI